MKVFVSWSGDDSKEVAEVLREYLPTLIQGTEVFMSKHDIASGSRWRSELGKELAQCNFGICCLTPNNLAASWLLFEAGALTKLEGGRACCLLLRGLTPASVTGPLSEFQNRVFSDAEFRQLLVDVNAATEKPIEGKTLELLFAKFWPDILDAVNRALEHAESPSAPPRRSTQDLLEEVLTRIRNLEVDAAKRSEEATLRTLFSPEIRRYSRAASMLGSSFVDGAFEKALLEELKDSEAKKARIKQESSAEPQEIKQSENRPPPEGDRK
jgi:TIR domain